MKNMCFSLVWVINAIMLLALIIQIGEIKILAPTEIKTEYRTYSVSATVSDVEPHSATEDIVCVVDSNGNVFSFYADANTYDIREHVACTIRTNGTGDVWDDEVINTEKKGNTK